MRRMKRSHEACKQALQAMKASQVEACKARKAAYKPKPITDLAVESFSVRLKQMEVKNVCRKV